MTYFVGKLKQVNWTAEILKDKPENEEFVPYILRDYTQEWGALLKNTKKVTVFSTFTSELVLPKKVPTDIEVLYSHLSERNETIATKHFVVGQVEKGEVSRLKQGLSYIKLRELPEGTFDSIKYSLIPSLQFIGSGEIEILSDTLFAEVKYPVIIGGKKVGTSQRYIAVYLLKFPYQYIVPLYQFLSQYSEMDIVSIQIVHMSDPVSKRRELDNIKLMKEGILTVTKNPAVEMEIQELESIIYDLTNPDTIYINVGWILALVGKAQMKERDFIKAMARFEHLLETTGYEITKPIYANIPVLKNALQYAFENKMPPIPTTFMPLINYVGAGSGYSLRISINEKQDLGGQKYETPFPLGVSLEALAGNQSKGDYAGVNIWGYRAFTMLVIGEMGAGKSYLMKTLLTRQMRMYNTDVIILDTASVYGEGEYLALANKIKRKDGRQFTKYKVDKSGKYGFKLLDPKLDNDIFEKQIDTILSFLFEVEEGAKAPIRVKNEVRKWAKEGKIKGGKWNLNDLSPEAQIYMKRLIDPEIGEYRWLFEPEEEIDISQPLLYLDLSEIQAEANKFTMFLTLFLIQAWQRIRHANDYLQGRKLPAWHHDVTRTIILLDEAWRFLMHKSTAGLLQNFLVDSRKQFAGLWIATQSLTDFTIGEDYQIKLGRKLWDESPLKFIRIQSGSVKALKEMGVPPALAEINPYLPRHSFLLISSGNKIQYGFIKVRATKEEEEIATTLVQS